jgi:hypothetical protein
MELTQGSETSANYNYKMTPGKYPKEDIQLHNKFVTSNPVVDRNFYNSCGSEINFVCVLLLLSVNLPHILLRQSLASPRFAGLCRTESLLRQIISLSQNSWM